MLSPSGPACTPRLPRNPHAGTRAAGGSSTGLAAVAVALGVGPFATGCDAGGSVRVPAALSGVFGIKPTFGRMSRAGDTFSGSLNHLGLIAVGAEELARVLDAVASRPDPADPLDRVGRPACSSGRLRQRRSGDSASGACASASPGRGVVRLRPRDRGRLPRCPPRPGARRRDPGAREHPSWRPRTTRHRDRHHRLRGRRARRGPSAPALRDSLALDIRLAMNVAAGVSAERLPLSSSACAPACRRQLAESLRSVDVLALPTLPDDGAAAPRIAR